VRRLLATAAIAGALLSPVQAGEDDYLTAAAGVCKIYIEWKGIALYRKEKMLDAKARVELLGRDVDRKDVDFYSGLYTEAITHNVPSPEKVAAAERILGKDCLTYVYG